ncbi:MAG: helix-turn-helix transcriptional regulator [Clostridiales bacterium]|nr:helix-turn-helix transcriptional regulator [Clostridiales bacterium]
MRTFFIIIVQIMYNVKCLGAIKMINLGKKLKELRKSERLTQQELAEKLGIGRVNYTRYETNAIRPDYETLIKIADFYDISLDELFDRD